jgi:hypothetical protein
MKFWKMKKNWCAKCGCVHAWEVVDGIICYKHICEPSNNNNVGIIMMHRPCALIYLMIFLLKIKVVLFTWKLNYKNLQFFYQ